MKKALASVAIIAFAGLLSVSLLTVFDGSMAGTHYLNDQMHEHSYFVPY